MITIGICDDEILIIRLLERKIRAILDKKNIQYDILRFQSADELLQKVTALDVVFLDIEMPGMDGIQAGHEIQIINPDCKIIMATSRIDRVKESFKINAFRFVTKPFEDQEIEEALESYFQQCIGNEFVEMYKDRMEYSFRQREISYAYAYNGYTEFGVRGKVFRKECSLNAMEEVLDSRCFFRVNKQYSVNLFHVQKYLKGKISVADLEIVVSRRKQKEFEKRYHDFIMNYR